MACMTSRIDPAVVFGVNHGDAHVIRNAGGNAQNAIRSIMISQHVHGSREIVLAKHDWCPILATSNDYARESARKIGGMVGDDFGFWLSAFC